MSSIKFLIGFLSLSLTGLVSAQTLEHHLQVAAENNPGLKARFAEFEAAMQQVTQANALPDPNLSFGYFISSVETRVGPQQAKIGLSQMFPWFGTLKAKEAIMANMAEAKYQIFLNAKNELFYKVKAAWYPLYELDMTLQFQEENREILEALKQLATTRFQNNMGAMVDVIRVDIMLDGTETDIEILKEKRKPLVTRFNTLLNQQDTLHVPIQNSLPLPLVEAGYRKDSLLHMHPLLTALDSRMESARAQEVVARKMGLPSFGIGIDYVLVGERTDMDLPSNGRNAIMPMVTMSLPVYRGKYNAAVKEARFEQEAITFSKEAFENELISQYESGWFQLDRAMRLIELNQVQIEKTEQALELLHSAYSNSGKDFEEILRMQQQLIKYQISNASALKEYNTALAMLDYLTSKSE